MKRKRTWIWIAVAAALVLILGCGACMVMGLLASYLGGEGSAMLGRDTVAVVEVRGVIVSGRGPRSLGSSVAYAENVIDDLERAENDPTVSAVVLEINSPGGGVVASADIHAALQEMTKPVVSSMVDVGASGGYYIACGTDYLYVRPATIVGSIGVIASYVNAKELFDKLGIEQQVIKTGEFKDQGSLYRRLTTEEREQLQALLEEALNDFVAAVAEGRGMSQAAVREYADGSIWSGSMAVEDGLADEEGDLHDAVDMAARLAGVRGKPQVVRYAPMAPTFVDLLRGAARGDGPGAEELLMEHFVEQAMLPSLQYLYLGP